MLLVPAVVVVVGGFRNGRGGVVEQKDVVDVGRVRVQDLHGFVFLVVGELDGAGGNDFVELGLERGARQSFGVVIIWIDGGDLDGEGARVGAVLVAGVEDDGMHARLRGGGRPGKGGNERGRARGGVEGGAGGDAGGPEPDRVHVGFGGGDRELDRVAVGGHDAVGVGRKEEGRRRGRGPAVGSPGDVVDRDLAGLRVVLLELEGEVAAHVDGNRSEVVGHVLDAAGDGLAHRVVDQDVQVHGPGEQLHPVELQGAAAVRDRARSYARGRSCPFV